jgi:uncharacterized protein YndB with AHSA1/START domain
MSLNKSSALEVNRDAKTMSISRVFNASPAQLWRIYTNPEFIPRWWGSRSSTTVIDAMDFRVGGHWRFVSKDAEGNEYVFRGEYVAVDAPTKLVQTFEFEMMPGHVTTDTYLFESLPDGRTKLTNSSSYASLEDLEGMLKSGMEEGGNESWDRLEEVIAAQWP